MQVADLESKFKLAFDFSNETGAGIKEQGLAAAHEEKLKRGLSDDSSEWKHLVDKVENDFDSKS